MPDPIHLQPTAALAERVLLPGDPGRALRLAQRLLAAPRMFNHNRGLWGYSGLAADGLPLTIQSTGMGGPSAAIVISELAELGARRLIRVGTCGALSSSLALGDLVVAEEALAEDGASRGLGATGRVQAARELVDALGRASAGRAQRGAVVTTDLFYDPRSPEPSWGRAGLLAVEMESATLFALAGARGLRAASLLLVTDLLLPSRRRIAAEELADAEQQLGEVAAQALSA